MAAQQRLFDADPEPWEVDVASVRTVAAVVLATGPDRVFEYQTPPEFCDADRPDRLLTPGRRVRAPFGRGNRTVVGYCVDVSVHTASRPLKAIAEVVDRERLFSPAMLRLTRWMADHYLCPWGQVLEAVAPAAVRRLAGTRPVQLLTAPSDVRDRFATLKLKSAAQRRALELLIASPAPLTAAQLARQAGCTAAPIRALLKQGLIEAAAGRVATGAARAPAHADLHGEPSGPLTLNADQANALTAIRAALDAQQATGLLLHGVTGSGKTEVYLQCIERVASFGRQAIVLVPEISLTPQTVRRFAARFSQVAVLHSHLTDAERHGEWQRIARGEVQVIIGARSAIFAPTPHLGLIVLDEEHESTFKQDSAPRYHAREVAWQRAQAEQIPLVLGSATPSLETWQRAVSGEFQLISLPKRVLDLPLPQAVTVDLRDPAHSRRSAGAISRPLHQAMVASLRDGGQVILLLNRRGFATHIQCPACGFVLRCTACDLPLTFHRQQARALCHYCDFVASPPAACPDCKSPAIRYGGFGTQRLEDEVRARFPDFRCARMDVDSMRERGSHDRVLAAFQRGEVRILLGTQMIAKGLDFPNVTLVGVVNADTALHLPDFRAAERTFQLVAQVAGRTGRGAQGGRVLVQTLSPEHPAIAAAVRHDFAQFAACELATRRAAGYPPFADMVRLVVRGPQEAVARAVADDLGARLRRAAGQAAAVRVLGPGAAPIARLRGDWRFHLQMQAPPGIGLQALVREATVGLAPPRDVIWTVDVDPWDMM